jgi:gamma-glutamyltranspeptidase/glutathione hydrolase
VLQSRPELIGDFGMVASTHWLASAAGMSVLERGGNAADACAAAGFVLQVVEPHLNGPGGDVPILVWDEPAQRPVVICGQGVAPQAATIKVFEDLGLNLVPGTGMLPAVVPGAFGAWCLLVERYGTWPVRDVLEPAVHLAEAGHPLLATAAGAIDRVSGRFRADWPTSAAIWLPGDAVPAVESRFCNPTLAATYRRIVAEAEAGAVRSEAQWAAARDVWYRGFVAEAVDRFCATTAVRDVSGGIHHGLLTGADLDAWAPSFEDPVSFDYHDYTVFKAGPWGQGPVFLQQLALLAEAGLADTEPLSADWVHLIVEATKLAFADREAWYGDPDFVDVPMDDLLWSPYTVERTAYMDASASFKTRPGSPGGRRPKLPGQEPGVVRRGAAIGEPSHTGPRDTCHVDVVDRTGLMIAATPSGGWLQGSPTIPGLGFCLGTRGQMFWLEDGLASSLRPGARPRTTLSPSLALRRVRLPGRRHAGPVEPAFLPERGARPTKPAAGHRCAGVSLAAHGLVVLPARIPARPPCARGAVPGRDRGRAAQTRARRRDRRRMVARPHHGGRAGRRVAAGRSQPARRPGLRSGPLRRRSPGRVDVWPTG